MKKVEVYKKRIEDERIGQEAEANGKEEEKSKAREEEDGKKNKEEEKDDIDMIGGHTYNEKTSTPHNIPAITSLHAITGGHFPLGELGLISFTPS